MSKPVVNVVSLVTLGMLGLALATSCGRQKPLKVLRVRDLVVEDARGESRISMKVDVDGMPFLRLDDGGGHCRLELKVEDSYWRDLNARINDQDAIMEHAVWLDGLPVVRMYPEGEKYRVGLGILNDPYEWIFGLRVLGRACTAFIELCRAHSRYGASLELRNGAINDKMHPWVGLHAFAHYGLPTFAMVQGLDRYVMIFPK